MTELEFILILCAGAVALMIITSYWQSVSALLRMAWDKFIEWFK